MTRAEWNRFVHQSLNVIGAFVLTAILLGMLYIAAFGKDGDDHGNHGALKGWFDHLASGRGLCCSFADGKIVEDVDWEVKDGKYRVYLDGKWFDVPEAALIKEGNRFGPAVVWPIEYPVDGKMRVYDIRCFMPGAGS